MVKANSTDVSYLTIAMVIGPTPSRAIEYMRDFGDLKLGEALSFFTGGECPEVEALFFKGQTFRGGIASLIDALGRPEFAWAVLPTLTKRRMEEFSRRAS